MDFGDSPSGEIDTMKDRLNTARLRIAREISKKRKDSIFRVGNNKLTAMTYRNGKIAGLRSAMKIVLDIMNEESQ